MVLGLLGLFDCWKFLLEQVWFKVGSNQGAVFFMRNLERNKSNKTLFGLKTQTPRRELGTENCPHSIFRVCHLALGPCPFGDRQVPMIPALWEE